MNKNKMINLIELGVVLLISCLIYFFLIGANKTSINNAVFYITLVLEILYFLKVFVTNTSVKIIITIYAILTFIFNICFNFLFTSVKTLIIVNIIILLIFSLVALIEFKSTSQK